jgi:flagellar basal-body rod protein FlgC
LQTKPTLRFGVKKSAGNEDYLFRPSTLAHSFRAIALNPRIARLDLEAAMRYVLQRYGEKTMTIGAIYPPLTAFRAIGVGTQSTAHNLANVATDGFKAGRVTYAELPGQAGVAADGPRKMEVMGPLVPYGPGLPPLENRNPALPEGYVEGSATDIPTEMVNLIVNSRTYQANAKTVSTADDMLGVVIDMKA